MPSTSNYICNPRGIFDEYVTEYSEGHYITLLLNRVWTD